MRDSGRQHPRDEGWLGAQHRWTVASLEASHAAVRAGLAYAWLPAHLVADGSGGEAPCATAAGRGRHCGEMSLYVVLVKGETAGPAARRALELLQRHLPIASDAGP